jgi:UDP-glucose 4-epimerase
MKRVLITGANSYVGTSVEHWLNREPEKYHVDTIDMIDGSWREKDFSGYEVVFHVAGIAHVKETRKNRDLFFKVNRDLAIEVARVSKEAGVSQFIFLSSMSVYGLDTGIITKATVPKPKSSYGKSKLQAEEEIRKLESDDFKIAILRPPMIYGEGCKGNFPRLIALAKKTPIFPAYHNQRSMLYIDNLCEFVRLIIDNEERDVFWPQNREYVDTCEVVRQVAKETGHRIWITRALNPFVVLGALFIPTFSKVWGTLVYDKELNYNDFIPLIDQGRLVSN